MQYINLDKLKVNELFIESEDMDDFCTKMDAHINDLLSEYFCKKGE